MNWTWQDPEEKDILADPVRTCGEDTMGPVGPAPIRHASPAKLQGEDTLGPVGPVQGLYPPPPSKRNHVYAP